MKFLERMTLLAVMLLASCPRSTPAPAPVPLAPAPAPPAPAAPAPAPAPALCPEGQTWVTPGCGSGEPFTEGCYVPCGPDGSCAAGTTCREVTIDPCAGSMCDACGAPASLCVASP